VLCTRDLVTSCLCHGRSIAPIVLTCQHEDRAFLGIDLADAGAAVPAAEVEVKVFVEDPVGLGGIQMPDELEVLQRCRGTHNLRLLVAPRRIGTNEDAYAVHLFWIVEGLIDVGRTVVELPLHVEVVGLSSSKQSSFPRENVILTLAKESFLRRQLHRLESQQRDTPAQPSMHRR